MADSACYIELASNAGDFFSSAAQDDILIHPHYATQNILLGTSNSQIPSITVTSNAVGIFESYPSYALDVQGDINFTGTFRKNGTPYIGSQWSNNNSNVFLGANSNVGIGKSNPAYPLDVTGDINFTGTFRKNGTPYVGSQWSNDNSNVFLGADSNVGIAMSNPYERLIINGNCLVASNDAYLSVTAPGVSPSLGICKKSGSASMFLFTSNYNNTFNNSLKFGMLTGTHLSNIATVSPVEYMVLTNSGNLGIGNSAPAYKLDVTGQMRANSIISQTSTTADSGALKILSTSGGTPKFWVGFGQQDAADSADRTRIGTVIKAGGGASLFFTTGTSGVQTEAVRIDDTQNVGIGTSNPSYRLDVVGTGRLTSAAATHGVPTIFFKDTSAWPVIEHTACNALVSAQYGYETSKSVYWGEDTDTGSYIFRGRNMGIGVTPSYKLDVGGVSRILGDSNSLIVQTTLNSDSTSSVRRISFKQTGFRSAIQAELSSGTWVASDILINPDGGNVGIGMNSPAYRVDVSGGSTRLTHSNAVSGRTDTSLYVVNTSTAVSADAQIWCTANTGGGGSAKLTLENLGQNAYSLGPDRNDSGKFKLANHLTNIASNVMLTVDTTGNVGIGTSNPAYKLDVNGNINFTGTLSKSGVAVVSSQWTSSACNVYVGSTSNVGIGTTAPGYTLHVVGTIYTSGDIIAFSDERAKSNLEVIAEPLSKVRQLTGYTYDMAESCVDSTKLTSKYTGLIAQQVMQVLPEVVHKDTDGKLSIAYGNIMGLVVEAIKEVDNKYKEEIQTLKNQMAQVMSKL